MYVPFSSSPPPSGFKYIRTECPSHFIPARGREGEEEEEGRDTVRFSGIKVQPTCFLSSPLLFSLLRRGGGLGKEGKQNLFRDIWLSAAAARICSMKKKEFCPKKDSRTYCTRFYNLICWPFLCPPCIDHDGYEVRITGLCGRMEQCQKCQQWPTMSPHPPSTR